MPVVGITGNIGSGKSTFAQFMAEKHHGIIIDADKEAHSLYEVNPSLVKKLAKTFGQQILDQNGQLQRQVLGEIVFADKTQLLRLNQIVHPALRKLLDEKIALQKAKHPLILLDAALIVEWNHHQSLDYLIVVDCPEEVRLKRVIARGLSEAETRKRMALQMSAQEKVNRAHFVVHNEGDLEQLRNQLPPCWNQMQSFFKKNQT